MKSKLLILAVAGVLSAGCAAQPAAKTATAPVAAPVAELPPPAEELKPFDLGPVGKLEDAISADEPVYSESDSGPPYHAQGIRLVPGPDAPLADLTQRVDRLVAHLKAGGEPASLPAGLVAAYIATLEPGTYVYNLGGPAGRPHGGDRDQIYRIERHAADWQAVKICGSHSDDVGVWEAPGAKSVLVCAQQVVLGTARGNYQFYVGRQPVLRLDGLPADHGLEFLGPGPGAMPRLRAGTRNAVFAALGSRGPSARERLTLQWQDGQYQVTKREWLADQMYYYARFHAFLGRGDYGRAAEQVAFQPEGGLEAYLRAHAPDLKRITDAGRPQPPFNEERLYVGGPDGVIWYTFGSAGKLTGIGQQAAAK